MTIMALCGLVVTMCGAVDARLPDSIIERSLVDIGNTARFQQVMAKARRGEPVTVGVIGGSITAGARASTPEKCWGALTADWWREAFPNSKVAFVNAGIGATCSDLGAHRVQQHLLSKSPDVVIVEYAVNDGINPLAAETLEGLLRQILAVPQHPAVALFFTLDSKGNNRQDDHVRVGRHYGLPMVSLRDALWPEVEAGRMAWTDFEADEVHPNDLGHAYSAQLLGAMFARIRAALPEDAQLPALPPMPAPLISALFEHTALLNAANLQPVRNDGWEAGVEDGLFGKGWKTDKPGSLLEFTVEGEAVSVLFWRIKGPMGRAEAWVDDRAPVMLEAWFSADWGGYTPFQLVARDLEPGKHTLHVRLLDEHTPESSGHEFQLRAVMTAGLSSPFQDAVAVWHMSDTKDAAGKDSAVAANGDVALGVELAGEEREASLRRGGDGKAVEFKGGYLSAGQGADGEFNLTGQSMTMLLRMRAAAGLQDSPLFSKHGGHDKLVYNLFCTDLGSGPHLGFELGTDWKDEPLRVSVPVTMIDPEHWHDVIVRFSGPKLELFVDGVLVDEEWPIGNLRQGNTEPCLLGAESYNGQVKSGFKGWIDHAALWNRAISDAEITALSGGKDFVAAREREILGPESESMAYWRPRGYNASLGDCMPFYHDGRFHLFYLFDRHHHGSKWGLGAHQWAHASTTDLVHWQHYPMAIPITDQHEGSICTGSVFFHDGTYYAHYAIRRPDGTQYLARAFSKDCVQFEKTAPSPLAVPQEGYDPMHYRDPLVFEEGPGGPFHMLVTARLTDGRDGCLAHLLSPDLQTWTLTEPFIIPGRVTDCPDYFEWNGWHYLFAEFVYWISKEPLGPWTAPASNRLDVLYVPKTAPFPGADGKMRRIYVSWIPDGGWAGNAVFRELVQNEDGTLGTKFVPEMIPASGGPVALTPEPGSPRVNVQGNVYAIDAFDHAEYACISGIPKNARVTLRINPANASAKFGVVLSAASKDKGCALSFDPEAQTVSFSNVTGEGYAGKPECSIEHVQALDRPFTLDVIVKGDIIDACIDNRRTIITRYKGAGDRVVLFASGAPVTFEEVEARPLGE